MSKKSAVNYVCQSCGSVFSKWNGKCEGCNEWNTIIEEKVTLSPITGKSLNDNLNSTKSIDIIQLDENINDVTRTASCSSELDRVLGGGFVSGSAILIGGDPGIGKSTLLLQTFVRLSAKEHQCFYVSGEESVNQIKLRGMRLKDKSNSLMLASATSLNEIIKSVNAMPELEFLVIDSIQTIFSEAIESAPGSVSQVKACAFELIRLAKSRNITLILVGHVTKDGTIAGPKVLEHMVDTVLYFEGEKTLQFRVLRAVKNRFGAANEIGVFEMNELGLNEVANPSSIFLPENGEELPGSCIFVGLEGTRPILLEIQALVVPSFLPTPRRAVVGWDINRLAMMIAVLNSRFGINLLDKEVYLNVTGGLRINEPAADLAVLVALISAHKNLSVSRETVFFGEVGLSGELRNVVNYDARINEAGKLGFKQAFTPIPKKKISCEMSISGIKHIRELNRLFS